MEKPQNPIEPRVEIPVRFQWQKPSRSGGLFVGFARVPSAEEQTVINARKAPRPLDVQWFFGPLLFVFEHDKATPPSGRFDEGISRRKGKKPSDRQIAQLQRDVRAWLDELKKIVPVTVAWGVTGRLHKAAVPDANVVRAWMDLIARLPLVRDPVVGDLPERLLRLALAELTGPEQAAARRLLDERAAARRR